MALATLSDASVSIRSGFVDLVGFSRPELPHYVVYPDGNYRYSDLPWWDWCSVAGMGVTGAVETASSFAEQADAEHEAEKTQDWLARTLDLR